jgi:hypothetical protein
MKYNPQSISRLVRGVIDNKPCLREWDDLVSITHSDEFTENMAQRLLAIQQAHSDFENGVFLDDKGVRELEKLLEELQSIDPTLSKGELE